jgi:uncharacterized protein (DUF58 family)
MNAAGFADFGSSAFNALMRFAALAVLAIGAALAAVFAFAAALVVAAMVAGAALAIRFWPRRKPVSEGSVVLEAHSTPSGWVVEGAARTK